MSVLRVAERDFGGGVRQPRPRARYDGHAAGLGEATRTCEADGSVSRATAQHERREAE